MWTLTATPCTFRICREITKSIDRQLMAGFAGSITHGTTAVSRQAVARIGGFRSHFPIAEDFDLYLRLAEVGRLANLG